MTTVVSVKVNYIKPKYNNLKVWMDDPNNVYIGRKGIVFVDNKRYPNENSIWSNPFKINRDNTREDVIKKYEIYITNKLDNNEISYDELMKLENKNLGCWCKQDGVNIMCHGDILVKLINTYKPKN